MRFIINVRVKYKSGLTKVKIRASYVTVAFSQ